MNAHPLLPRMPWLAAVAACVLFAHPAAADVKPAAIFGEHMVLQRDTTVPVWGWADPGEKVTVSIAGQSKSATAGKDGKWLVKLDKLTATEPQTLTIQGNNKVTLADVLIGEVWLASGQSNMAMTVNRCNDFEKEQTAAKFPKIRMFKVTAAPKHEPQSDCKGKWEVCSPETVATFSATGYFFARAVHQSLKQPVGIINSSVGGTGIEAWTSREVLESLPGNKGFLDQWAKLAKEYEPKAAQKKYEEDYAKWQAAAKKAKDDGKPAPRAPEKPVHPHENRNGPSNLFNGMIAPLIPYAIRGTLWYQGEHNAANPERAKLYAEQLPLLIKDWRARWGQGDTPFVFVQLPNIDRPLRGTDEPAWALLRESMLRSLKTPNTGMAITIDIGEAKDVHPKNKQDVGQRLAQWALAKVYSKKVAASGPLFTGHQTNQGAMILAFDHTDEGLTAKGGKELKGFEIAGEDKKWHPAEAKIVGNTVIVTSPQVAGPVAVRYAWANNPECNLYNKAGLPASPFRTETK